jgi:hypothetical protein
MKMPEMTPTEEANYALDNRLNRDNLPPEARAEYDRLLGERYAAAMSVPADDLPVAAGGADADERKPWRELTREEKQQRRAELRALTPAERRERLRAAGEGAPQERLQKKGMAFPGLGVRVHDGQVYRYPTMSQPTLGPLAGARAEITDPTKAQMVRAGLAAGITSGVALGAVLGPFALAPGAVGLLRKSKAVAFVICANGKLHEKKLDGTAAIRAAQRDAVKFNTLASRAEAPVQEPAQPAPAPPTPSERLAEVTRLHDEGLLTDEEYQAKRAEIISQL